MDDEFDVSYEHGDDNSASEPFGGHDAATPDDYRYAIPELAGAQALASASASGSPKARRRARIMVAVAFGLPIGLSLLLFVFDAIGG